MSDLLNSVTNAAMPKESIVRPDNSAQQQVQQVYTTEKVIKTNVKDSYNENKPGLDFNYDSISNRTAKMLSSNESVSEVVKRSLFHPNTMSLTQTSSKEGSLFAQFFRDFFFTQDQLLNLLQSQTQNSIFQGPLFAFLQNMYQQTNNQEIQNSILNVLKIFDLYNSQNITLNNLQASLQQLLPSFSSKIGEQVNGVYNQLLAAIQQHDHDAMLASRKDMMTILSAMAAHNKDNTSLRNMIMLSVHHLTRLDQTEYSQLTRALEQLFGTLQQYTDVAPNQKDILFHLLHEQLNFQQSSSQQIAQQLAASFEQGLANDSPIGLQLITSNMLSSILMNNSIMMPLVYGFIPLQFANTFLFSEFWAKVDRDESHGGGSEPETRVSIFFTVESSILGSFQGMLKTVGNNLEIQLESPESFLDLMQGLGNHLAPVLAETGYNLTNLSIVPLTTPKKAIDVFGKQMLKEAYINVRI